jgi:hypothetical protein
MAINVLLTDRSVYVKRIEVNGGLLFLLVRAAAACLGLR